ncbi:FMRFamide receptor-like [Tigriopus californicus]|uniref:FMRFamide receptor-like n=1 Tax=Tigriopus californicus TaxID=6832 RepID=UPI0027DA0299|nr:FMRFamide receptor-like [Tigriopus californicus]
MTGSLKWTSEHLKSYLSHVNETWNMTNPKAFDFNLPPADTKTSPDYGDIDYGDGLFNGISANDKQFMFIVEGLILTIVSILGITGTVMSIGVLIKPVVRETFSALLTGLAVCDTLFLCTSLIMFGLPKLCHWFAENVTNPSAPVSFGLIHIWRVGSTCLTLSVTLERYCAICHPLGNTKVKQKYLLIGSLVFATLYNIPKFFEMKNMMLNNGQIFTMNSPMRENRFYKTYYVFWSKFILIELFPYCTIIILNTLILTKTLKASKFRRAFQPASATNPVTQIFRDDRRKLSNITDCIQLQSYSADPRNQAKPETQESFFEISDESLVATPYIERKSIVPIARQQSLDRKRHSSAGLTLVPAHHKRVPRNRSLSCIEPDIAISKISFDGHSETSHRTIVEEHRPFLWLSTSKDGIRKAFFGTKPVSRISVSARKEKALGATLIGVSVLFLTCQSVKLIPDIYEGFFCEKGASNYCRNTPVINTIISLSNLLMCINSAANFLMYMVRGTKFRRAFILTYSVKCCR